METLWSGEFEFFVPEKNRKQNVQRIKTRNFIFLLLLFSMKAKEKLLHIHFNVTSLSWNRSRTELLDNFHLRRCTLGFHLQKQKLEPPFRT